MVRKKFTATKTVKGQKYQYFRKDGKYIRLPDDPGSEEYDREYWRIMRGGGERVRRFTFDKLIVSYRNSPRFRELKPKTRASYQAYLEYLHDRAGTKDTTRFVRSHAIAIQEANAHRPRTATYILQVLSILFEHSIDLGWRRDNPAKGIRKLKTQTEHKPWPIWALAQFRAIADEGTLLLFELALGTGQRAGDVLKMKWSDFDGEGISLQQNKTGAVLWVPCTRELLAVLAMTKRKGIFIVTNYNGNPLTYSGACQRMRRTSTKAGTLAYTLHGLRYSAASKLAEMGATDAQIAAITGHKARAMVAKYSSGASQKRLAREVLKLRKQNENKT